MRGKNSSYDNVTLLALLLVVIAAILFAGPLATVMLSSFNIGATADTNTTNALVPDESGVMMYDYGGSIGRVYNPVMLQNAGMEYYKGYIDRHDEQSKEYFINTADWLVAHATDRGNYSLWEYTFPWPFYEGLDPPYSSALAQAAGTVLLSLAYNITNDDRYVFAAEKAFGAFLVDYDEGGVVSQEDGGTLFLQELAKPGYVKTYILNGHVGSLLSLWEYYTYSHDNRTKIIFDKGVGYLKDNLQKYDTGNWSYFDQVGNLATESYQRMHIAQLEKLYELTKEPVLKKYSDKFVDYLGYDQATGPKIKDPKLKVEEVAKGLEFPTSMAFVGSNDIVVLEKDKGTVRRVANGTLLEQPLLDVNVGTAGERGILGITISMNETEHPTYVFLYFTETCGFELDSQ